MEERWKREVFQMGKNSTGAGSLREKEREHPVAWNYRAGLEGRGLYTQTIVGNPRSTSGWIMERRSVHAGKEKNKMSRTSLQVLPSRAGLHAVSKMEG
jgi:hypothetical protein